MKVYRYEHKKGKRGPYQTSGLINGGICHEHGYIKRKNHPTPYDSFEGKQFELDDNPGWICGCSSRRSLGTWFRGWKSRLLAHGFVVREYNVPDDKVIGPDKHGQVVFWPVSR